MEMAEEQSQWLRGVTSAKGCKAIGQRKDNKDYKRHGTGRISCLFYGWVISGVLIFLNDLNFQIVKGDGLYEVILVESCFAQAFEICNVFVQPYGFA